MCFRGTLEGVPEKKEKAGAYRCYKARLADGFQRTSWKQQLKDTQMSVRDKRPSRSISNWLLPSWDQVHRLWIILERRKDMTLEEKLQQVKQDMSNGLLNRDSEKSSEDSDICPICRGTEWITEVVDGVEVAFPCKCREENRMRRRIRFAEIPEAFKDMTLATFRTSVYKAPESRKTINVACVMIKEYIGAFDEAKSKGMGLYLYSRTKGSGKPEWRHLLQMRLCKSMIPV